MILYVRSVHSINDIENIFLSFKDKSVIVSNVDFKYLNFDYEITKYKRCLYNGTTEEERKNSFNKSFIYKRLDFYFNYDYKNDDEKYNTLFKIVLMFFGMFQLNRVMNLTQDQMPLISIYRSIKELKKPIQDFNEQNNPNEYKNEPNMNISFDNLLTYIELMGFFTIVNDTLKKELLDNGLEKEKVDELKNDEYVVFLCRNNINNMNNEINKRITKESVKYFIYNKPDILYEIVLWHEIGHCVFNYASSISSWETKEKQANYISSIRINTAENNEIMKIISKIQKISAYKSPYLFGEHFLINDDKIDKMFKGVL